ncbi:MULTISPECIES: hypothetical protein [unclassified Nodularia (in: cyanobacteria)]|uniref:hypothetical protein n=1 Tax=unclassified Nodularia (in: cyanobacteria) TaxID=2656917 RepID=UPI0018823711|nr:MULTISPECIES: hypothetical protein [unclassified Nodularia (in: cyanobacteria)]MBE9199341.1 hypothetical protein [Nodularia sp. LEGE 06071]MCC2694143.1 hypothetical protein [Nodularia sp. LEGE 04288]
MCIVVVHIRRVLDPYRAVSQFTQTVPARTSAKTVGGIKKLRSPSTAVKSKVKSQKSKSL